MGSPGGPGSEAFTYSWSHTVNCGNHLLQSFRVPNSVYIHICVYVSTYVSIYVHMYIYKQKQMCYTHMCIWFKAGSQQLPFYIVEFLPVLSFAGNKQCASSADRERVAGVAVAPLPVLPGWAGSIPEFRLYVLRLWRSAHSAPLKNSGKSPDLTTNAILCRNLWQVPFCSIRSSQNPNATASMSMARPCSSSRSAIRPTASTKRSDARLRREPTYCATARSSLIVACSSAKSLARHGGLAIFVSSVVLVRSPAASCRPAQHCVRGDEARSNNGLFVFFTVSTSVCSASSIQESKSKILVLLLLAFLSEAW